jgi:hypothetical protein
MFSKESPPMNFAKTLRLKLILGPKPKENQQMDNQLPKKLSKELLALSIPCM